MNESNSKPCPNPDCTRGRIVLPLGDVWGYISCPTCKGLGTVPINFEETQSNSIAIGGATKAQKAITCVKPGSPLTGSEGSVSPVAQDMTSGAQAQTGLVGESGTAQDNSTLASQPNLESYNPLPHGIGCCCRLCSPPLSTPLLDGEEDYSSLPKATSAGSTPRAVAAEVSPYELLQRAKHYVRNCRWYKVETSDARVLFDSINALAEEGKRETLDDVLDDQFAKAFPAPEAGGKTPLEIYDAARFDAVTKSTLPMPMATGVGHIEALEAVAAQVRKEEQERLNKHVEMFRKQLALERSEKADLLEALNEERQSNYSVAVSKLRKEIEAEKSAHETNLRLLRDLLAVIHCDGGHYVVMHGLEKATEDAISIVVEEKSAHEETRKRISDSFPFPLISAGSADALAYQFEVGRENHSCPMDDTTIAEWLRDCAKKLRTLNQPGEKK